ncbi:sensor histidine kinase [Patulibacter defluvii]|uniref:sensor histidine kinase n=1 Tax=Patulibacter defluvii TaxID=3095358 RepID=UPI002A757D76|nr:histidine kinase [Patulibacter sp. DM4]
MTVVLGMLLGVALTVSALALARLLRRERRLLAPADEAMRDALHQTAAMLPDLRRGLTPRTAQRAVRHVRALAQAPAVLLLDRRQVLARDGDTALDPGDPLPAVVREAPEERIHVEPQADLGGGPTAAVVAALRVGEERVGTLLALFPPGRVRAEDARVVAETAALVSAQLELSVLAEREERAATAELRALRAQISPHFVFNAMAAIASLIHTAPDEARELLTEFAAFTRYAFREQRSYVTLADELHYVEKYLRLEQARFRERLEVRVEVAPEVLQAAVPVLSLQPLVENAVRHGVERRVAPDPGAPGRVTIVGRDADHDVELRVSDDGPGVDPDVARSALSGGGRGGIGLRNVDARLRASFGPDYGLRVTGSPDEGTTVTMLVPKYRAGVRAQMVAEGAPEASP